MEQRLDTLQKVEIAEGVEIVLRPAGVLVRGGAFMLDMLIKFGITIALATIFQIVGAAVGFTSGGEVGAGVYMGLMTLASFALEWIYSIAFEVSSMRATPGKRAFKLRVAQVSGSPITIQQSIARNMLKVVDMLPFMGAVGLVTMLCNNRFQRLGDLVAQTVVVYQGEVDLVQRARMSSLAQPDNGEILRPTVNLNREEQLAILMYYERAKDWTQPRIEELANHAGGLVKAINIRERVHQIYSIARWIRSNH